MKAQHKSFIIIGIILAIAILFCCSILVTKSFSCASKPPVDAKTDHVINDEPTDEETIDAKFERPTVEIMNSEESGKRDTHEQLESDAESIQNDLKSISSSSLGSEIVGGNSPYGIFPIMSYNAEAELFESDGSASETPPNVDDETAKNSLEDSVNSLSKRSSTDSFLVV